MNRLVVILLLIGLLMACSDERHRTNYQPPITAQHQTPQSVLPAVEVKAPSVDADFLTQTRTKEAPRLQANREVVRREGNQLFFRIKNGQEKVLNDVMEPADDVIIYDFIEHYPRQSYYLAQYTLYEGGGYLFINQHTGEVTRIAYAPVLSPDSTRFVVASEDIEAAYSSVILEVYRFTEKGLRKEFSAEPNNWGPANPRWQDSTTVLFDKLDSTTTRDPSATKAVMILRKTLTGQWAIEPKP